MKNNGARGNKEFDEIPIAISATCLDTLHSPLESLRTAREPHLCMVLPRSFPYIDYLAFYLLLSSIYTLYGLGFLGQASRLAFRGQGVKGRVHGTQARKRPLLGGKSPKRIPRE